MAHKHSVYDSDLHFAINPITRTITNMSSQKTTLIQYDHNSERFTFELPRHVEGHDMSVCNVVEVHYLNIEAATKVKSEGVYAVTDLQLSPEDENVVICSWLISQNATRLVGSLNFLVRFACVTDDTVDYVWNTAIFTGIAVSSGIYNGDVIVEQHADILEQWKNELDSGMIVSLEQTKFGSGSGDTNIWTATFGDGRISNFTVKNGFNGESGLPDRYTYTNTTYKSIFNNEHIDFTFDSEFVDKDFALMVRIFEKENGINVDASKSSACSVKLNVVEGMSITLDGTSRDLTWGIEIVWSGAEPTFTPGYTYFLSFVPISDTRILGAWSEVPTV